MAASRVSVEGYLGGWGSAKTTALVRRFLKLGTQLGWHEGYGSSVPTAVLMAPTSRILLDSTMPKLLAHLPPELILKQRGLPHPFIQLVNGLKILLVSAEASLEGLDCCLFGIDEISHEVFATHPAKWLNYIARLRDPHARSPMAMLAVGLPLAGWVRETFDVAPGAAGRLTILTGTRDNPHVPQETIAQMLAACPAGMEGPIINGTWGLPIGATFPMWSSDMHLTRQPGDPARHVHLGIDIGNHGAIMVAQDQMMPARGITGHAQHQMGLHIVGQLLTDHESVDAACYRFRTETEWTVQPGRSRICIDPTTRRDEEMSIRKHFPGAQIVKRARGDQYYDVDAGLRLTQAMLRDALGNVRLKVWSGLAGKRRGIVEAMEMAKGNPRTGQLMVVDDQRDHPIDALRYLVSEFLAAPRPKAGVVA